MNEAGRTPRRSLILKIWKEHIRSHTGSLCFALILLAIAAACAAGQAQLLQPVFDRVMVEGEITLLLYLPLAYVALGAGRGLTQWLQSIITARVGGRIVVSIQRRIFDRLLSMDLDRISHQGSGTLVSRFTYDLGLLREMFTRSFVAIPKEIITLLAYFGLMFYHNTRLTLIALVAYPLIAYPLIRLARKLRGLSLQHQHQAGYITHFLGDCLRSLPSILIYGAQPALKKRADAAFEQARYVTTRTQILRAALTPINETLGGLAIAVLLGFGGYEVTRGNMSVGQFTTFLAAMMLSYQPIRSLSGHNAHLQEGLAVTQRMYELLDQVDRTQDIDGAQQLQWKHGHIRFEHATRRQPNGTDYQFHDVSFDIPPGKKIALFGPSGAGKTSLVNALLRFIPLDVGRITIDEQDIAQCRRAGLRQQFAYVSQENLLMDASAAENILMGEELDKKRLARALKLARADTFLTIDEASNNERHSVFDRIGEAGSRLSGGQQQRIALARAFYRGAHVVILDEPTSALDKETERTVLKSFFHSLKKQTVIFITHNPDNLIYVDEVFVINQHRLITRGTPDDVLKKARRK